jgi:hypothetical protein
MKLRTAMLTFLVCALVACAGGRLVPSFNGANTPDNSVRTADASPAFAALSQLDPQLAARLKTLASNPFACTVGFAKVPGTYATLIALDASVRGSAFKTLAGNIWIAGKWVKATPSPSPSPGATATPKATPTPVATAPPGQPLYVYVGSYSLRKYGQGCAFVLASVNGKKIKKQKNNAYAIATPIFRGNVNVVPKTLVEGPLSISIRNLGANGGKGTVVLLNATPHGKNVDSGTITLTSRTVLNP